jgi:glucosamine-6-phosphate deaminase
MRVVLSEDKMEMASYAAETGIRKIKEAIGRKGKAVIVLATGLSQVDMLSSLVKADIPWEKVEVFHLDEYVALPQDDPASFHSYLERYFTSKVKSLGSFHAIDGNAKDLGAEVSRLNALIDGKEIDVAFLGIGENGHLAFNDPPADLDTKSPFITVNLDERCRRQQVAEGWFPSLESVPQAAITMSVRQIIKAKSIIATVPDLRKARAVAMCMFDEVGANAPCAILRWCENCELCIDRQSAALVYGDRRSPV